jgi:hypothetical protein
MAVVSNRAMVVRLSVLDEIGNALLMVCGQDQSVVILNVLTAHTPSDGTSSAS